MGRSADHRRAGDHDFQKAAGHGFQSEADRDCQKERGAAAAYQDDPERLGLLRRDEPRRADPDLAGRRFADVAAARHWEFAGEAADLAQARAENLAAEPESAEPVSALGVSPRREQPVEQLEP